MHVIEFQDSFCRVFSWQSAKNHHVLKSLLVVPLEKADRALNGDTAVTEKNAAAIRQALRDAGLRIREALAIVPKQWVTLRIVNLPSSDPSEVEEMARFEAERHIPFNVERHVISHHVLRFEGLRGAQVVIAAMDGPPAQETTAVMEAAGIHLLGLDVSSTALVNALMHSGAWDTEKHPTVAQVNIGQTATDINILHNGLPVFARSIAQGVEKLFVSLSPDDRKDAAFPDFDSIAGLDIFPPLEERATAAGESAAFVFPEDAPPAGQETAPETAPGAEPSAGFAGAQAQSVGNWVNRLVHEIRKTYDFARREFDCGAISQVFYSGIGFSLPNLKQILQAQLEIALVELDPFVGDLSIQKHAKFLNLSPSAYAIAAGGLLRDAAENSLRINLLPEQYVRSKGRQQKRRSLVVTASLAVVLVICAFFYANRLVTAKERHLEAIQAQLAAGDKRAREITYRKGVVRILKAQSKPQGSAIGILNDASGWTDIFNPGNMRASIMEFDYTAGKVLILTGEVHSYEDLNNLRRKLEGTGHFAKIVKESTSVDAAASASGIHLIRYKLNCYFEDTDKKQ